MPSRIDPSLLHGRWLHAHEEDTPGQMVFRPASHPLPPARGRNAYEFLPGGRLASAGPGADDRSVASAGTWTLDDGGRVAVKIPGQSDEVLNIESLDADRMVLKK